jgi:RNA recognition motif-containing protein
MHVSLLFLIFIWIERCALMYVDNKLFCSAKIIMDCETGRSKGFGFMTYSFVEEARAAITGMDVKVSCFIRHTICV